MGLATSSLQRRIAAIGVGTLVAGLLGAGVLAPVAQAAPAPDVDTAFIGNVAGNSVTGIGSGVGRVAVQSDGKILLTVGYDTTLNATGTRGIARLNADGSPDTSFNTNIVNANLGISVATSIMELSNGQILVGTEGASYNLLLLDADGQVAANQPTWQPPSIVNFWDMFSINVIRELPDGKVLVGGEFPDQLVRLELVSGIWVEDTSFVGKAALEQNSVQDLVVLNDGSIVVAGAMKNSQTGSTPAQTCGSVIKLNADGTLNDTWCASFGAAAPDIHTIYSLALEASGAIIAGGQAAQTDVPVNRIVTSGSTATLDAAFAANINAELPNESTTTFAILVQSDGDILVGSEWRCCNAAVLGGLRRFHADGTFDVNFDSLNQANYDATVKAIASVNGQVIAGGSFTLVAPNNSYGGGIARFQGPPTTPPLFTAESPSTTGTANSVYSSYTFLVSGTTPITFTVDSGSLPPGLSLSTGGVLSGTPTTAGSYTFTVKAANGTSPDATTASITITIAAAPNPGTRPNAPKQPVILAGDGTITVTVERGAGGGTPARFTATATPSGSTCRVVSTTGGSCVISGLTKGRVYTVTATATNSSGTSDPSTVSQEARPGAPVTPNPEPLPRELPAGGSFLMVNGQPQPVEVTPNSDDTGLSISGDGFEMNLDGLDSAGEPMNLGPDGVLILGQQREVLTSGSGFMPGSQVKLYVDPSVQPRTRARAKPIYIGSIATDRVGSFSGTAGLPTNIAPGVHNLQAVGVTRGNLPRAMTLGVRVAASPGGVRHLSAAVGSKVALTWKLPRDRGHSQIIGYQVRYRLIGVDRWTSAPVAQTNFATLSIPLNGCTYVAEVRAVNQIGAGTWNSTTFVAATGVRSRPAGDIICGVAA